MISGFHGPPVATGQRLRSCNRGWSLVVKSCVKSLVSPDQVKLDGPTWLDRSNSKAAGVAKLLKCDFTARDRLLKLRSLCLVGPGGP